MSWKPALVTSLLTACLGSWGANSPYGSSSKPAAKPAESTSSPAGEEREEHRVVASEESEPAAPPPAPPESGSSPVMSAPPSSLSDDQRVAECGAYVHEIAPLSPAGWTFQRWEHYDRKARVESPNNPNPIGPLTPEDVDRYKRYGVLCQGIVVYTKNGSVASCVLMVFESEAANRAFFSSTSGWSVEHVFAGRSSWGCGDQMQGTISSQMVAIGKKHAALTQ